MSSPNESKPVKKRAGRKRLPPLAPGPALQFVVANHPDDFKADDTMRNIRSHVMYKHRGEQRGGSPGDISQVGERSKSAMGVTRTPSPMVLNSEDLFEDPNLLVPSTRRRSTIWDGEFYKFISQSPQIDPLRNLAARIISATTADPPRSAPAIFGQSEEYPFPSSSSLGQESLDDLKNIYISNTEFGQGMLSTHLMAQLWTPLTQADRTWMETVCSNRMSFLSHVSVTCVHQDVTEGLLDDSALTVYAKTKLLRMIKDSLQGFTSQTDDFTILSILYLLVSEVGGYDEDIFDVHQQGLVRIIQQRGGLSNLGHGSIATFLIVVVLSFTVLRGQSEPAMLHGFAPSRRQSTLLGQAAPVSPLYPLHGDVSGIYGSCSDETYGIIHDMHELTKTFTARWNYIGGVYSPSSSAELASLDISMQQIYTRLLLRPSSTDDLTTDWVYESCRLASLIYCRSIVQGVPLAESADVIHARGTGSNGAGITVLQALHNALENTDKSGYWGDMCGVFLWVSLVGGAGSWGSTTQSIYGERDEDQAPAAWVRKCFALYAVQSSIAHGFEHAGAVVEAQRTMLQVQTLINLKRGIASQ